MRLAISPVLLKRKRNMAETTQGTRPPAGWRHPEQIGAGIHTRLAPEMWRSHPQQRNLHKALPQLGVVLCCAVLFCFVLLLEMESSIAQAGFELLIVLLLPPKSWSYRPGPLPWFYVVPRIKPKASCILSKYRGDWVIASVLTFNFRSSCLHPPSAGMMGEKPPCQVYMALRVDPRVLSTPAASRAPPISLLKNKLK